MAGTKVLVQTAGEALIKRFGNQLTDRGKDSLRIIDNNIDIKGLEHSFKDPIKARNIVDHANNGQLVLLGQDADEGTRSLFDQRRQTQARNAMTVNRNASIEPSNNFTITEDNLAPDLRTDTTNVQAEISQAMSHRDKVKAIEGDLGEGGLSTASTIGQLPGQQKGYNLSATEKALTTPRAVVTGKGLGTNIKKIKGSSGRTRTDILAERPGMPYLELHHIFGKKMGEKIISNVWDLIDQGKASWGDLVNLNHWAKSYGIGMGDYGTEAVNRVPHSLTHGHSRKFGLEMSGADIKEMPYFDNMDELTSYFRETIQTRVLPMRGELDLQQGAYNLLPEKMRLDVEQLKVAKEDASRELTQSYKEIYKKKMKDTPPEVKDAYQTHKWIQEELGVTDGELIEKARKLDEARLAQDQQMAEAKQLLEVNRNRDIQSAEGKQIKKERKGSPTTTRVGQSEKYAATRIDPKVATERKMLEAGAPTSEADRLANIELIKSGIKPTDILYQDSTGKWKKRKTAKKQSKSKRK